MAKLALLPLLAVALLVELTEHGFRIDAEGHLLDLHGLEELGGFALGGFGGEALALAGGFSASRRFCSGVLESAAWDWMVRICFWAAPPFFWRVTGVVQ